MSKLNTVFAAIIQPFTDRETGEPVLDKNDKPMVYLSVFAGKYPSKRTVLAGTIAENNGFIVGKRYLVQCTEKEIDETYGRQFNFQNLGEISVMEAMSASATIGAKHGIDVVSEVSESADVSE